MRVQAESEGQRLTEEESLTTAALLFAAGFETVQLTGRRVSNDTEISRTPIAGGHRVVAYLGAANRDPDRFPDPDRLDLSRDSLTLRGYLKMPVSVR
jgi:cytochrome P450